MNFKKYLGKILPLTIFFSSSFLMVGSDTKETLAQGAYTCFEVNDYNLASFDFYVHAREDVGNHFGTSCFTYRGSSPVVYRVSTNGSWTYDPGRGYFDANGDPRRRNGRCQNNCQMNDRPSGSLVARFYSNGNSWMKYIGTDINEIVLRNGDRLYFMNNDTIGSYKDNRGKMNVYFTGLRYE